MIYGSSTDKGLIRSINEDSYTVFTNQGDYPLVFILADGMGGHRMGELASSIAVGYARERIEPVIGNLNDIEEIKVAVSEAISNAVIHGYGNETGMIDFSMALEEGVLEFIIKDYGKGIADIALARQPSYSSDPERMGLGFVFMESFMDELRVESEVGKGTTVHMIKKTDVLPAH